MEPRNSELDRLLQAAAKADDRRPAEMSFGFDTRIVARWRAQSAGAEAGEIAQWFRRIATVGALVTVLAIAGSYWQMGDGDESDSPLTNAYAIADSAIENGAIP